MEKKDIKQFLHLYHGCQVQTPTRHYSSDGGKSFKVVGRLMDIDLVINQGGVHFPENRIEDLNYYPANDLKPLLRPLSSMTEEEAIDLYDLLYPDVDQKASYKYTIIKDQCTGKGVYWEGNVSIQDYVKWFPWLLSKGFDLFGLIESGLAIDSTLKPV